MLRNRDTAAIASTSSNARAGTGPGEGKVDRPSPTAAAGAVVHGRIGCILSVRGDHPPVRHRATADENRSASPSSARSSVVIFVARATSTAQRQVTRQGILE